VELYLCSHYTPSLSEKGKLYLSCCCNNNNNNYYYYYYYYY